MIKTLILGLGNPILTDDGIGIHVVREVAARSLPNHVTCAEASLSGLRLLEIITGYERVIMVDAIQPPEGKPGEIHRLRADDLRASLHVGSTHDLSLPGALRLGRSVGMALPGDESIIIFAVEVEDVLTFGENVRLRSRRRSLAQWRGRWPSWGSTAHEQTVCGIPFWCDWRKLA